MKKFIFLFSLLISFSFNCFSQNEDPGEVEIDEDYDFEETSRDCSKDFRLEYNDGNSSFTIIKTDSVRYHYLNNLSIDFGTEAPRHFRQLFRDYRYMLIGESKSRMINGKLYTFTKTKNGYTFKPFDSKLSTEGELPYDFIVDVTNKIWGDGE